jgi:hypothetical protein
MLARLTKERRERLAHLKALGREWDEATKALAAAQQRFDRARTAFQDGVESPGDRDLYYNAQYYEALKE